MGTWLGTKEIFLIWHGDWSDPELRVNGFTANYFDVEDYCSSRMEEEDLDFRNDLIFSEWVCNHENEIIEYIEEVGKNEDEEILKAI